MDGKENISELKKRILQLEEDIRIVKNQSQKNNSFLKQLIDSVGQAMITTDISGTITYFNHAAENLYGWKESEVLGKNIINITPANISKQMAEALMKKLSKGESWKGTFPVKRKDGSEFIASVTDTPIFNNKGEMTGIIGISYDVSGEKDKELKLSEAYTKVHNILESISDGFFSLNQDLLITY